MNRFVISFSCIDRFPYLLQDDHQLMISLDRHGWQVNRDTKLIFYNKEWISLGTIRVIFWTFPMKFFANYCRKPEDEQRILLSLG
jgi:hypothetical protein